MHLDQRWADLEVIDGKIRAVVYDGDEAALWRFLNSGAIRHDANGVLPTDSLPYGMQGFPWAGWVD